MHTHMSSLTKNAQHQPNGAEMDSAVRALKNIAKKRDWYLNDDARVSETAHLLFYLAPLQSLDFKAVTHGGKVIYRAKPAPDTTVAIVVKAGMVFLFELKYGVSTHDKDIYLTVIVEAVARGTEQNKADKWFRAQTQKMWNPKYH